MQENPLQDYKVHRESVQVQTIKMHKKLCRKEVIMHNIAIDGPAGAGKSTIARMAAEKLGFIYVDL